MSLLFTHNRWILFTRNQWEQHPTIRFSQEELNKAENNTDGFIGYSNGCKCYLWRYIKRVR